MTKKRRSTRELRDASEHLDYEMLMLTSVAYALDSGVAVLSPMNNALIESFVIHLRNLMEFLWPENPTNDMVVATDYFDDPDYWPKRLGPMPQRLRSARIRAAKEIAHLSYDRIKLTRDRKAWQYVDLLNDIGMAFAKFVAQVDRGKICPELLDAR